MKMLKLGCLLVVLMLGFCISAASANAQSEPTYLGEICFTMVSDVTSVEKILQLGVLSFGSGHFPVDGKITAPYDFKPVHGNAEIDVSSGYIFISLSSASGTIFIAINPTVLSGSYDEIDHVSQVLGAPIPYPLVHSEDAGSLTLRDCP